MSFSYSSIEHLEVFRDGPVGWLVNDRPDVRNAMSGDMREEFAVAWRELDADPLDSVGRDRMMGLAAEERIRDWTNQRVRATVTAGGTPGAAASIGKVHQAVLNQSIQLAAVHRLGAAAMAWEGPDMPHQVRGMIRSRANSIEGGTTEINKNVLGEQVLGLPREPDPWHGSPWQEVPRS